MPRRLPIFGSDGGLVGAYKDVVRASATLNGK